MLRLLSKLASGLRSTFKTLIASQPQLPFDINRQVQFWLPFVLLSIVVIIFLLVTRSINIQEEHVFQSSEASIALGELSTKVSEEVMRSTSYLMSPNFDPNAVFSPTMDDIEGAQERLQESLLLHPEALNLQHDIAQAIEQDLAFASALANGQVDSIDTLRVKRLAGPNLQLSFKDLAESIRLDREEHLRMLKVYQRSLNLIIIAGFLLAVLSILYSLRLSGHDLSTGFNRLTQDVRRLRRGERLSISSIPTTEMSPLDKQLLETSLHLQEQNEALAAKTTELELQQKFRKGLSEFVSESLQHGFQTNFYQKLLERAVHVIPDSQAGSLLLLRSDGRYHYEAVLNYQLESMPVLSFDSEEIALHYSDSEPSRFQDFSINQELDTLDSSESTTLLADSSGGRHRAVMDSLAIPVKVDSVTQAYLTLDNFDHPDVFGNEAVSMAEIFAAQVGTVITRLNLQEDLHLRQIEIQQRNEELARADRLKSEFLANMSHELRTPLTAILGFAELLKEELFGELNRKQSQYVGDIYKSGDHLLSLINDILDLSKIEAGHMDLNRDRHNIAELIDSVIGIMKERARKANIHITTTIPGGLDALFVDGRKVKQVLFNLISNAVKFTPEGGNVTISVVENEDRIEIQVQDTGIGISQQDQQKLFQEFSQLDSSLTKTHEGTGLGLVLSKRFVELHGGKIWLDSTVGKGSTFVFSLPFGTSQVELHKEFKDFSDTKLRPGVVIVAEADLVVSEVNVLKQYDYRVLVTNDSASLVEQLSRPKRVDLIIVDEAIHKGTNFTKEITELLKVTQQRSPIMVMPFSTDTITNKASVESSIEKEQNTDIETNVPIGRGIDAYFHKPYSKGAFLEKVSSLIYRDIKKAKVLLVGTSDFPNRDSALKDMISTLGHTLTECVDGETALAELVSNQFDLLLCHFSLDDMSAADLLDMLEDSDKTLDDTTVVLFSEDDSLKEFFDDSIFFDTIEMLSFGKNENSLSEKNSSQNNSSEDSSVNASSTQSGAQAFERLKRYLWYQSKSNLNSYANPNNIPSSIPKNEVYSKL